MKYKNLIFDLYGTLVDIHTETEGEMLWEKTALYFSFYGAHYSGRELENAYEERIARMDAMAGQSYECFPEMKFETIFEELFQRKGVTEGTEKLAWNAAQVFRILSIDYIRLYPGVKEALERLRGEGHALWLLSNAQRVFTQYELEALGLSEYFDGVYLSSDYGCRKPDIRFFETLFLDKGIAPQDALMIGNDLEADVEGAKKAGLTTLFLRTNMSPQGKKGSSKPKAADYVLESMDWFQIVQDVEEICR